MNALAAQSAATVLAHAGGAPETVMVGAPIVVLAVFALMEKRARKREKDAETDGEQDA